jgi:hypothetical protein
MEATTSRKKSRLCKCLANKKEVEQQRRPSWTPLIHMEAEEAFEVETLHLAGRSHCILGYKLLVRWSTTVCRRNTSVELSACSHRLPKVNHLPYDFVARFASAYWLYRRMSGDSSLTVLRTGAGGLSESNQQRVIGYDLLGKAIYPKPYHRSVGVQGGRHGPQTTRGHWRRDGAVLPSLNIPHQTQPKLHAYF